MAQPQRHSTIVSLFFPFLFLPSIRLSPFFRSNALLAASSISLAEIKNRMPARGKEKSPFVGGLKQTLVKV